MAISRKLYEAVKLSRRPQYLLAHRAGLHPSTLSKILRGIEKVLPGDSRVLRIGKLLGIPESELFKHEDK